MEGIVTYGRANGGIPFNLVLKHRPLKRGTTTILINFGARISLFFVMDSCKAHWNYQL
jgi:hypothetical protein